MGCMRMVISLIVILIVVSFIPDLTQAAPDNQPPVSCMVLITSTSGGSTQPDGAVTVPYGSDIVLMATPQPGFEISQILIDGEQKKPSHQINLTGITHDMIVHAQFTPLKNRVGQTIETIPSGEGTWINLPDVNASGAEKSEVSSSIITVGPGRDYAGVQEAIANASPGSTIIIDPGTYTEQISIQKPLILAGRESGSSRPTLVSVNSQATLIISSDNVSLSNLLITGGYQDGDSEAAAVRITNASGVSMDRVTITESENGITLKETRNVSISSSSIRDIHRYGINFLNSDMIQIERTSVGHSQAGVLGQNSTRAALTNNLISTSSQDGVIFREGCSDTTVTRNLFSGDVQSSTSEINHDGRALSLEKLDNGTISGNRFLNNSGTALFMNDALRMTITNNTFTGNYAGFTAIGNIANPQNEIESSNTIDGLPLMYMEGISGRTIEDITPSTLYLQNCSDMIIRNLVMPSRNGFGIVVKGGKNISIVNCSVSQNIHQNILFGSVNGVNISESHISNGIRYGIGLMDIQNGTISGCSIHNNGFGIAIKGDERDLSISGNELTNNVISFFMRDSTSSTKFGSFSQNKIQGSHIGILSISGGGGSITNNQVTGVNEGINLSGAIGLHIEDNHISTISTGIRMSRSPDGEPVPIRQCSDNIITRNSITTGSNPIQINDSSEWVYGNSILLNDFSINQTPVSSANSTSELRETDAVWGGISITVKTLIGNTETEENMTSYNQWDTGERIRYTYGGTTFSGNLGNHWSPYRGNEIGASGVGDQPHEVNTDNNDSYPLISPHTRYQTGSGGYPLILQAGWNLISTPSELTTGYDTARIFEQVPTAGHSVYTFRNGSWIRIKEEEPIKPLSGYWIFAENTTTVSLLFDPGTIPSPVHLIEGWNLIGHPGIQPSAPNEALSSLDIAWSYLIGYNASTQRYEDLIEQKNGSTAMMFPSHGYWISMNRAWDLQPITG